MVDDDVLVSVEKEGAVVVDDDVLVTAVEEEGAVAVHVGAKFKRFPERVMNHVQRNIKFKDCIQVLEFKDLWRWRWVTFGVLMS